MERPDYDDQPDDQPEALGAPAARASSRRARARRPPRRHCRRCGARLWHADCADFRCTTCRLEFDPADASTYLDRWRFPHWSVWAPGVALAVLIGVASYGAYHESGVLGTAAFFVLPASVGAVVGYTTGLSRTLAATLAAIAGLAMLVLLANMGWAGLICMPWLAAIAFVPLLVGALCGTELRRFAMSRLPKPPLRVLAAIIALPWLVAGAEVLLTPPPPTVVVRTSATFDADPAATWDGIAFYEQVDHEPPWLLRWAMPNPVGVEGASDAVGDEPRCVYESGYLVKRITVRDPGRELAFDVIEQRIGMEKDVILRDGRFLLSPRENGGTDVVLETRYDAPLRPRWLWEPAERMVVHDLHEHVLLGMRSRAKSVIDASEERFPAPVAHGEQGSDHRSPAAGRLAPGSLLTHSARTGPAAEGPVRPLSTPDREEP